VRQVVLDTETTGLEPAQGHRIIEIGAVEIIDRKLTGRHFHKYVNPQREVDDGAFEVHGISDQFLADKPLFDAIVEEFVTFLSGCELIIHNAGFDVAFLDHEFARLPGPHRNVAQLCSVTDSLALARHKHPGQKNDLDALCRRYQVNNSSRTLHGALLDAEILADVYLLMTGGQTALFGSLDNTAQSAGEVMDAVTAQPDRGPLRVIEPSADETAAHHQVLDYLDQESGGSLWRRVPSE